MKDEDADEIIGKLLVRKTKDREAVPIECGPALFNVLGTIRGIVWNPDTESWRIAIEITPYGDGSKPLTFKLPIKDPTTYGPLMGKRIIAKITLAE